MKIDNTLSRCFKKIFERKEPTLKKILGETHISHFIPIKKRSGQNFNTQWRLYLWVILSQKYRTILLLSFLSPFDHCRNRLISVFLYSLLINNGTKMDRKRNKFIERIS